MYLKIVFQHNFIQQYLHSWKYFLVHDNLIILSCNLKFPLAVINIFYYLPSSLLQIHFSLVNQKFEIIYLFLSFQTVTILHIQHQSIVIILPIFFYLTYI